MYEFKKEDAYRFKNHVGALAREKGDELIFAYCPYCHGGKNRDKDKFSINLKTGQFECKRSSCSAHGNMITLARDFDFQLSEEVTRYYNINDYNSKFKKFRKSHKASTEPAIQYMKNRGISEEICKKYEITTKKDTDNIIVFPFKDISGELKFIKYRKSDFNKEKDKNKEWCESDCMPILFGMYQCDPEEESLVITEGQIDSLSVAEAGIKNAVSVPTGANGFTWIPHCWEFVSQFKKIIVFGDCEKEKITLADEITRRFGNKVYVVQKDDYKDCKDANEILQKHGKQAIVDAVKNAKSEMKSPLVFLKDIESRDLRNMSGFSSGIKEIDKILGKFYYGQLIILSGKAGDGKSTFMSQLIVEAISQNVKTMVYSGELVNYYFKRWIDLQVAGEEVIENTSGGYINYDITKSTMDQINRFYGENILLYDWDNVETEYEDLIKIVKLAIDQHDCKFICLDNLMTAISVDRQSELYNAQSNFVERLCKIAKAKEVTILLVAHPRKGSGEFTNDEVSGSSDITKKADVVMYYRRNDDMAETERDLAITKNRLTGKLTNKTRKITLNYNEKSKRIVGADMNFSKKYIGDVTDVPGIAEGFEQMEEDFNDEIPF